MLGLYIHIPFCAVKCSYCDFYSLHYSKEIVGKYVEEVCRRIKKLNCSFDTVYFGGGTPSIIGAENLSKILSFVNYNDGAEITVEVNPKSYKSDFFETLNKNGFNRISIGMQSANDDELKLLTRNHNYFDVTCTVNKAREAGFKNISLDVMLGIQKQTPESLSYTLKKCIELNPEHLSCYMLKIEENTPYSEMNLILPDDDIVSDMYLNTCNMLESAGYNQYEISNFSKSGFESRHNLIYWNCEDYIGIGPSAHSLIDGKRYYFPNDIDYFLAGKEKIFDDYGGGIYDYIMLGLRLKNGISSDIITKKGYKLSESFLNKFKKYCELGYACFDGNNYFLTPKGFLIQNTILCELLEEIQ